MSDPRSLVYEAMLQAVALERGVALSHCAVTDPDQLRVVLSIKRLLLEALEYKLDR